MGFKRTSCVWNRIGNLARRFSWPSTQAGRSNSCSFGKCLHACLSFSGEKPCAAKRNHLVLPSAAEVRDESAFLARRRALQRKLAGLRGKLAVVRQQIAEIQAQEKPTSNIPGLFGQQATSHPGLRALQDRKRQLERVVEHLEGELRGK